MLSRADFELFVWKEEDLKEANPQVKDIGAPLEAAENIYLDIQNMYKWRNEVIEGGTTR